MRLQKAVTDRHTDRQTDRQTDAQTGLIPGVNIFSNEMTEYKNETSFRIDFESLMTNMAIFSTSVALLPNKITEKTVTRTLRC